MNILLNPIRTEIIVFLQQQGGALPYSVVAKEVGLHPLAALAHLDLLTDDGLLVTHFGQPSIDDPQKIERTFEIAEEDKVQDALEVAQTALAKIKAK